MCQKVRFGIATKGNEWMEVSRGERMKKTKWINDAMAGALRPGVTGCDPVSTDGNRVQRKSKGGRNAYATRSYHLTSVIVFMLVFGFASTGISRQSKCIKTYPAITTTYGGVFENVDILRVDVNSIYCRSQIGCCDIPLAHLPREVLADLESYIAQAKTQALQEKEAQRRQVEAEQQRIEAEQKRIEDEQKRIEQEQIQAEQQREEAERLRIYNAEQSRKRREELQAIQDATAESQSRDEEEKKASASNADRWQAAAFIGDPFVKSILIIITTGVLIAGLLGRTKPHRYRSSNKGSKSR